MIQALITFTCISTAVITSVAIFSVAVMLSVLAFKCMNVSLTFKISPIQVTNKRTGVQVGVGGASHDDPAPIHTVIALPIQRMP